MTSLRASRNVLVQGSSRGLGLALAQALVARPDVGLVFATCRDPGRSPGLEALRREHPDRVLVRPLDVRCEKSIGAAAEGLGEDCDRLHLLLNCSGILHDDSGLHPEKKLEQVQPENLVRAFEVNAFGPLLVAKHFLRFLRHDEPAVLANVSARVGSIGDNRSGGWYGYRASKAAQNMFTRTLAVELRRRAPNVACVALHPGTVDTDLSRPFQRSVPKGKLFSPEQAARQLLAVIDAVRPEQTGSFLAFDGSRIPW